MADLYDMMIAVEAEADVARILEEQRKLLGQNRQMEAGIRREREHFEGL